ncbi:MAG TPA: RiPP maturation radical SAM C-methyltransferase [Solirubrobacteraceae bacterium]|nr:RiPP maturation radical SAM C-methyltransferase [Solirubrobacteraceae bacterium]
MNDRAGDARATDVVFVVMPFADVGRPAIGVSLLKAIAAERGYGTAIEYCNIEFADRLGAKTYGMISSGLAPDLLVGEWVFAEEVFGNRIPPGEDYLERVMATEAAPELVASIAGARVAARAYLDACVARVMAHRPRMVGFTTTFHQTCACLALAKRLKALPDPPLVLFGGANCEGEMGVQLLATAPWIDAIFGGEADESFPRFLDVALGDDEGPVAGVVTRDAPPVANRSKPVTDLDALPIPDYDEYFAQIAASEECRDAAVHVVVETSRGCWWGVRHHCTFCGLNGDTMAFRSKSPQRAFDEIVWLARHHGLSRVGCVDNILDMRYIETLFPMLADSGVELEMFYEVKANLRRDQLVKMHRGGIRQIQPGIESFSNRVLKLMDKGVSGVQNVQLMRWCEELGIDCAYNILAGFPREPPEEYERMGELIPLLEHLEPPMSTARLRLDRFSPFHANAEHYGFRRMRPARAYFYVFPLGRREMSRLAYFFDYDYADDRIPETYLEPVLRAVSAWWRHRIDADGRPRLDAEAHGDAIVVHDTREVATAAEHRLEGTEARVYARCDRAATLQALVQDESIAAGEDAVRDAVDRLVADRLLVEDEGRYLSLAVFRSRPDPAGSARAEATAAA